jgi:hypothetical protein
MVNYDNDDPDQKLWPWFAVLGGCIVIITLILLVAK